MMLHPHEAKMLKQWLEADEVVRRNVSPSMKAYYERLEKRYRSIKVKNEIEKINSVPAHFYVEAASRMSDLSVWLLLSPRRGKKLTIWRARIADALRRYKGMSYSQIGKVLNRDHSTILHGIQKYGDENIAEAIHSLAASLYVKQKEKEHV